MTATNEKLKTEEGSLMTDNSIPGDNAAFSPREIVSELDRFIIYFLCFLLLF